MNGQEDKLKRALVAIKKLKQRNKELSTAEPIAVVGMGCRFPGGVSDPESFWKLLEEGKDVVGEVPKERWDIDEWYDADRHAEGKMYSRWGGFLSDIDRFDPTFFGISPREAANIDPQQRLLLEVAWEALENAGQTQSSLQNSDTGVYVGICGNDYQMKALSEVSKINAYSVLGTAHSAIVGRLSYILGLKGPNVAIDTACSSSLVSVHMAVQALRNNECSQAVAGGVNVVLSPEGSVYFSRLQAISPTGKCHTFSSKADGFVRSEGCGMIVLKRLSDAQRDGDHVQGVIRGSAINQDGNSQGFTAPNGPSQQDVIRKALLQADMDPASVDYVEAHGTGTELGDPIEISALSKVIGEARNGHGPLMVGSVKTNIGHAEGAAGIAGIIKSILSLQHECIPQSIHFDEPNPHIFWDEIPIKVVDKNTAWPRNEKPRVVGVSSFGFSGTNAHVVLEEAPLNGLADKETPETTARNLQLVTVSAKKPEALMAYSEKLKTFVKEKNDLNLADLAFSLATTRTHFNHREAFVVRDVNELSGVLEKQNTMPGGSDPSVECDKVAFLFTGQGSQYWQMGKGLYETEPVFREALDQCAELLKSHLDKDLLDLLFHDQSGKTLVNHTGYTQPALFALEYALARLWMSLGIEPAVLIGHSIGEVVAACIAGVFTLEEAILLIANRGRLMQSLPEGGTMLSVKVGREEVLPFLEGLEDSVSLAAENAPNQMVLSGKADVLESLKLELTAKGVKTRQLEVSHAFHSPLMEPVQQEFKETISGIRFKKPVLPVISNLTGELAGDEIATPDYWVKHIRGCVRFSSGVQQLEKLGIQLGLEIGPHPVLSSLAGLNQSEDSEIQWLFSLKRDREDQLIFLQQVAEWYKVGGEVNWTAFYQNREANRITLPTYPYQRKRYWLEESTAGRASAVVAEKREAEVTAGQPEEIASHTLSLNDILTQVKSIIMDALKMDESEISDTTALLEIGADSIVIMEVLKKIERTFRVKIPVRRIFEELTNIKLLGEFIYQNQPKEEIKSAREGDAAGLTTVQTRALTDAVTHGLNGTTSEKLKELLQIQQNVTSQLLDLLNGKEAVAATPELPINTNGMSSQNGQREPKKGNSSLPAFGIREKMAGKTNPYLEEFIKLYAERTKKSKAYTAEHRPKLADNRASAGFRFSTKEILYPLVSKTSEGSRFWDIDDNEYIDITMGFGSSIFGHQPEFVTQAVQHQLGQGMHIGPQSHLVGEVSELFTRITGLDRVCFVNTGTEAVMTAIRLARTHTNRKKLVIFSGAYHGHFDGVLGMFDELENRVEPMVGGTPRGMVEDLIVVDYCTEEALQTIQHNAHEIAGVLVEPVQSRHPEQRPGEFLKTLRELTSTLDIPLIFDEMITGFRLLPGGAQEYFGVKADIATYGKILGGGMPIGAIAGDSKYLDAIDGGAWNYGDQSYPEAETTFLAGTFSKHPLAMASARAVLAEIERRGNQAFQQLNTRTRELADRLNTFFEKESVGIEVVNTGSLFRFKFRENYDLLFFHLIRHGVYIWEGRNCFLSFAHTDEDINAIFEAVSRSIHDMKAGGILAGNESISYANEVAITSLNEETIELIPATTAQKQLWVLDKVDRGGSLAYTINTNLRLKGDLNVQILQDAIKEVVSRHEALNHCFDETGDYHKPLEEEQALAIPIEDLSDNPDEALTRLDRYLAEQSQKTFSLTEDRLIRFQIIQLNAKEFVLAMQAHHIICDGISTSIILQQITETYTAKLAGNELPAGRGLSYSDYLSWQREQMDSDAMQEHARFWVGEFKEVDSALNFPADRLSQGGDDYKGNSVKLEIGAELFGALRKTAESNGCTSFMLLFAAYATWLHRLSGQQDLVLGFPVSGRFLEDEENSMENLVAYNSHLLPVKSHQKGEETFLQFLRQTVSSLLTAFEHQEYPHAELLRSLGRNMEQGPLISTVFNVDKVGDTPVIPGMELSWLPQQAAYSNMDFKMNLTDFGDTAVLECIYRTALFEEDTINRYVSNFISLLGSIVENPQEQTGQLTLLRESEVQALMALNENKVSFPEGQTIVSLFEEQAEKTPDQIAVSFGETNLSYDQLNKLANQLAAYLKSVYHLKSEEVVAIQLDRSEWMIASILAVLKAGAAYVPLDSDAPEERSAYMLQDSDARLVLNRAELDKFEKVKADYSDENREITPVPNDLAYIIYTSGSTGKPKGVAVEHHSLINYINWFIRDNQSVDLSSSILLSTYTFDGVYTSIYGTLLFGGTLHIVPKAVVQNPEDLLTYIVSNNVSFLKLTPSYLRLLIHCPDFDNIYKNAKGLSLLVIGGEAIFPTDVEKIAGLRPDIRLINHYGPTEVTIGMSAYHIRPESLKSFVKAPLIGKPVDNVQIYVLDKSHNLLPQGAIGEICAAGAGLARGYINNELLTRERFIDNPFQPGEKLYLTGDLGRWTANGNIETFGRKDEQVKVRGYRIELGEIEAAIIKHEAVEKVAVTAVEEENGNKALAAYVVSHSGFKSSELRDFLEALLPQYMVPSYFIAIDQVPLTTNGKTDRKALPWPVDAVKASSVGFEAPRNTKEQVLADAFSKVLKCETVGLKDSFYDLGGDSIKSIQVVSQVKQSGYTIRIEDILRSPVLEDIARKMEVNQREIDQSPVEGPVTLAPIQHRFFQSESIPLRHHYNQSVVLRSPTRLNKEGLALCFEKLLAHHDGLRMVYSEQEKGWHQEVLEQTKKAHTLAFFDLRRKENAQQFLISRCERWQSGMNLETGPLVKAALFRMADGDRLVIIIHHLVMDGVSWRILIEDLTDLYDQYASGADFKLPLKTDSYKQWTASLTELSQSQELAKETPYWQKVLADQAIYFPVDAQNVQKKENEFKTVSFTLSREQTIALKTKIHQAYRTETNEVILTALGLAVKDVFKVAKANVILEGHGREDLGFDLDVTRTIGWFTSIAPFLLDLQGKEDAVSGLITIKEDLRRIPAKGVGYGVIKYLGAGFEQSFTPHIAYNFLGDFDTEHGVSQFEYLEDSRESDVAKENRANLSLLDIMGMIVKDELTVYLGYETVSYQQATIEKFMVAFEERLKALISQLSEIRETQLTPSDLSFKNLTQEEFDKVNEDDCLKDVYPLSPLQEGIYFHWLSSPGSPMYMIQRGYHLPSGKLTPDMAKEAFDRLVDRYDILRTSFNHSHGNANLQIVKKRVESGFRLVSLPGDLSEDMLQSELERIKQEDRDQGFDLRSGSQIRLTVVDKGAAGLHFIWSYHHILMDGWCANILLNEFDAILNAAQRNKQLSLPEVVPYVNYIHWLARIDQKRSLSYWNEYLSGYETVATVPFRQEHHRDGDFTFQQHSLKLDGELHEAMRATCKAAGVTESVFIQTAWGYLLSKYNNNHDVVFGTVVSGRPQDLEGAVDMVGLFINTIPVRISYNATDTPGDLIRKTQEEAINGIAHHFVSLSEVQSQSELGINLFNHILEFENYLIQEKIEDEADQSVERSTIESFEHTHYDLAVVISPQDDQMTIDLNYNADYYQSEGIERIRDHFLNVIKLFIEDVDSKLLGVSFLNSGEAQAVLTEYNNTEVSYPTEKTLINLFEEQVQKTPENVALAHAGLEFTYQDIYEKADRLAATLQEIAGVANQPIPLVSHKGPEQVWGTLGILMAGAHYVPIKATLPEARINELLNQLQPSVVLSQEAYLDKVSEQEGMQILLLHEDTFAHQKQEHKQADTKETDLAYIIFTSGSTGKPKGVMIDHRGAVNTLYDINARYNVTAIDRVFGISDLNFDLSVYDIFGTLACGATLVLPEDDQTQDPAAWLSLVEKEKITVWNSVPQLVNLLIDQREESPEADISSLRLYMMSGDWIPTDLPDRIRQFTAEAQIISMGGATEGSIWSIYYPIGEVDPSWSSIPYGMPLGNQEMYILNDDLEPCPIGIPGGIYIGGKGVARGYYKDPEKTGNSFFYHARLGKYMYRTGDMGYHHTDGYINFLGRLDGQVKIRGYRIELGEIESTLQQHAQVETAVAVARTIGKREKELVAYVVTKDAIDPNDLRTYTGDFLPDYMVPAHFVILDQLPLTANGKVDQKALPSPEIGSENSQEHIAPASTLEEHLVQIWSEVLESDKENISVLDNFFEIGGQSIKAIRLISKINKSLQVDLKVKDLFEQVTVREQAKLIAKLGHKNFEAIPEIGLQDGYELSPAQRRLWVLCQFEATNVAYNMTDAFELKGHLDIDMLQQALERLVARHEILRTVFKLNQEGEVRQYILEAGSRDIRIEQTDLQSSVDSEAVLKTELARLKAQAFDLAEGPLLKIAVYQLEVSRQVLFFNMHHIISDGWSMDIFARELFTLYNALVNSTEPKLEPLSIQYKDFAAWQIQRLESTSLRPHREYWLDRFSGGIPVLELPAAYARPPVLTNNGAKVSGAFASETARALHEFSQANGGTLFMVVLSVVKALMYRYTGQNDLIIGSPVAGRDHDDLDNQIGFYINTLALRTRFDADSSFEQLFDTVKGNTLEAYDHQVYPFHDLVDALNLTRDLSRSALFDVMVDLQHVTEGLSEQGLDGLDIKPYPSEHQSSKLDLSFDFFQQGEELSYTIEYNTDIYSTGQIEALSQHLVRLTNAIVFGPKTPLKSLNYLSEQEADQLRVTYNDTARPIHEDKTLVDLFTEQVKRAPESEAVQFGDVVLDYQTLDEKSSQLARYLLGQEGAVKEGLAGIMLERSEWMIVAVLAVLKSGQAYVPIDPAYPQARIDYMLENSSVNTLVDNHLIEDFLARIDEYDTASPEVSISPDQLAYVIYTSGSTGQPKGVMLEHRSLVNNTAAWKECYALEAGDTTSLQLASMSFDVFFGDICRTVLIGGKMVICPDDLKLDWENLYSLIATHQVSIFEATPGLILPLMEYIYEEQKPVDFLKTLVLGSDGFNIQAYYDLQEKFGNQMRIINSYGTTEAAVDSTWFESTSDPGVYRGNTPIGRPLANTEVYVLDPEMALVPHGVEGEICIGGLGLARGYWQAEEITQARFVEHPFKPWERLYKTGDLGRWSFDGQLEFLGRGDHQVKVRGYRIELAEIETALESHPAIEKSVAVAVGASQEEKELVAYVKSVEKLDRAALRDHLSQLLPAYMIPAHFVNLDTVPLTPNGKVDRNALPAPEFLSLANEADHVAARNSVEEELIKIWAEILKRQEDQISIHDNFFELGGHSLRAVQLMTTINKRLGLQFKLSQLFTHITVSMQAELMMESVELDFESIPKVAEQESYALSSSQQRLWVLCQFEAANAAYNMPGALSMSGALDKARFEAAFAAVVARHEILRTVFKTNEQGEVRQYILPAAELDFSIDHIDLTKEKDLKKLLDEQLDALSVQVFDLANGPLLKAAIFDIDEDEQVFFFNMHHIISDGWSIEVLIKEVFQAYNALMSGTEAGFEDLPVQYKDYAHWQRKQLDGTGLEGSRAYWLDQFSGEIPVIDLPADHIRPAVQTYNGAMISGSLSKEVSGRFNAFLKEEDATLFMGLMAVLNTLLHHYTHQEDLVIGSPIANREHSDLEGQIGLYINTLALRTQFNADEDFKSLLNQVKEITLKGYDHQAYPFDTLVDELNLKRDLSRSALFDVMLVLQNNENLSEGMSLQGIELKDYDTTYQTSKFDLLFNFIEVEEGLRFNIEYNSDIYEADRIERMCQHLTSLIEVVIDDSVKPLNALNYISDEEEKQLLIDFNQTAAEYDRDKTMFDLIEAQVKARPDAIALVFEEEALTFREVNQRANQLADYLKKQYEIKPEDLVGLMLERSPWMIISILAIIKADGAYVPIDPEFPQERVDYIRTDANCKALIDQAELDKFREVQQEYSKRNKKSLLKPEHLMYVIYTSGSTGRPKGCMLEHRGLVNRIDWMWKRYGWNHDDVVLQKTTNTFDVSVWEIFMPLAWGCKMVLSGQQDIYSPERLASLIEKHGVTITHFVPSMLNTFLKELEQGSFNKEQINSLKSVITSGEALSVSLVQRWYEQSQAPVYNLYGPTEASIDVTYFDTTPETEQVLIGRPIANTQIYLLNDQLKPSPIGVVGEICLGGDGLSRGYLNKPELTADKFIDHPFTEGRKLYKTGDLGRWLPDGNVEFIGRKDHQVKIRGYRIELGEIEAAISGQPHVSEVIVLATNDQYDDKKLVAFMVCSEGFDLTGMRTSLTALLPAYMVPSHFTQVEEIPLTFNGKVNRRALLELADVDSVTEEHYMLPENDIQKVLVDVWAEILARDREMIGVAHNFFEIGGNSLKVVQLMQRVEAEFGVKVEITDFFGAATIRDLSRLIEVITDIGSNDDKGETEGSEDESELIF